MGFWIAITAIATAVIAYSAWSNNMLAKEIKKTRQKQDEETKDLFQAMVISNIASGPHRYDEAEHFFKKNYQGKTEIFLTWPLKKEVKKDESL